MPAVHCGSDGPPNTLPPTKTEDKQILITVYLKSETLKGHNLLGTFFTGLFSDFDRLTSSARLFSLACFKLLYSLYNSEIQTHTHTVDYCSLTNDWFDEI